MALMEGNMEECHVGTHWYYVATAFLAQPIQMQLAEMS